MKTEIVQAKRCAVLPPFLLPYDTSATFQYPCCPFQVNIAYSAAGDTTIRHRQTTAQRLQVSIFILSYEHYESHYEGTNFGAILPPICNTTHFGLDSEYPSLFYHANITNHITKAGILGQFRHQFVTQPILV